MSSGKVFLNHYILSLFVIALVVMLMSLTVEAATESSHGELPLMKIEEVTDLIMSPGCKYLYTLTLCPSGEADQMREIVKGKLLLGDSTDDILFYFKEIYGPRVLAQPAKEGFYFVAWWFPYFLLFDVFLIVGVILLIWRRRATDDMNKEGSPDSIQKQVSPELGDIIEEEVRRFRDS